jgi:hypothetical protein
MKPIMDVAVKKVPQAAWAGRTPRREKGMTTITTSGVMKERDQCQWKLRPTSEILPSLKILAEAMATSLPKPAKLDEAAK